MPSLTEGRQREEDGGYTLPYSDVAPPIPQNPSEDFFRFRIDGSDIIAEIQAHLRGEVWDDNERSYVKKFDRWCNEEGINKITHIIYSLGINKNIFLGNLAKEQILYKCKMLKKKLALLLFKKYTYYEIKKEMRDLLVMTVVNMVHSGLSRSEGGRESEQLSTASQRHDIYSHQEGGKKDGIISRFLNRRN